MPKDIERTVLMADSDYIDFVMDKLSALEGVSTKRMFGGNVIHIRGRVLGFVFQNEFFFEPGPNIDRMMPLAPRQELFPGSKLFVMIDESISRRKLCELALACYEDFPISKPRKRKGVKIDDKEVSGQFPFARHVK